MGDTQTQCAVMRYSKGKLEVLGYGYDHHLGGRNFTAAIAEHFRQEWKVGGGSVVLKMIAHDAQIAGQVQD